MSAYDNDPRVQAQLDGTVAVDDGTPDGDWHVCPGEFGGWVTHLVGLEATFGPGFDTRDEAIRSLIGDPQ